MKLDPRRRRGRPATASQAGLPLALGRAALGVIVLAAPVRSMQLLGVDTGTARRVSWLTRMVAIRDGVLGAGGAAALRRGGSAGPWLLAGALSDLVDAAALAAALKQGRLKGVAPTLVVPLAVGSAARGGVAALRQP